MKILYVVTHSDKGGTQTYVHQLASTLHGKGDVVALGVGSHGWLTTELENRGIKIYPFRFLRRTYNPVLNILFSIEMHYFLQKHQFDIIHFNSSNPLFGILGSFFSRRGPTKLIFTFHGLSLIDPGWRKARWISVIYRWVLIMIVPFIDHCIFVCERDLRYAQEKKILSQGRNFSIIYSGIEKDLGELNKFSARKYLEQIAQKEFSNALIIGTITRLHYQKNIDLLIAVANTLRIPNVVFCILGTGPEKERLHKVIQQYGLDEFCFILDVSEPRIYIKAFDIFVISSRYEGIPFTIIEAMKNRLPIIATDVGGISEAISHDISGVIVHSDTQGELVEAIRFLIDNPSHAQRLAHNASAAAQTKFTQERMVSETYQLYKALCGE